MNEQPQPLRLYDQSFIPSTGVYSWAVDYDNPYAPGVFTYLYRTGPGGKGLYVAASPLYTKVSDTVEVTALDAIPFIVYDNGVL